jgi:hypothetical protein
MRDRHARGVLDVRRAGCARELPHRCATRRYECPRCRERRGCPRFCRVPTCMLRAYSRSRGHISRPLSQATVLEVVALAVVAPSTVDVDGVHRPIELRRNDGAVSTRADVPAAVDAMRDPVRSPLRRGCHGAVGFHVHATVRTIAQAHLAATVAGTVLEVVALAVVAPYTVGTVAPWHRGP